MMDKPEAAEVELRHRATIAGAYIKNTALAYALADRPVIGGSRRGT